MICSMRAKSFRAFTTLGDFVAVATHEVHVQSNVTYPDATYASMSDIRQWGVLNNVDSMTHKI